MKAELAATLLAMLDALPGGERALAWEDWERFVWPELHDLLIDAGRPEAADAIDAGLRHPPPSEMRFAPAARLLRLFARCEPYPPDTVRLYVRSKAMEVYEHWLSLRSQGMTVQFVEPIVDNLPLVLGVSARGPWGVAGQLPPSIHLHVRVWLPNEAGPRQHSVDLTPPEWWRPRIVEYHARHALSGEATPE